MWLCQSILFQHQFQKENGDHTFRLSGTAYITSSLLYNKVTGTNASALLRNFTYNQSIKRTIIFFRRRDRYEKMEKNPDISDNSLCTGHASGRIGNSAWHSLCYRGRSRISSSKLTDPYEILTQKDASELANDTLDMAVPYWADLLKGSGITLRSLGFSTTK